MKDLLDEKFVKGFNKIKDGFYYLLLGVCLLVFLCGGKFIGMEGEE